MEILIYHNYKLSRTKIFFKQLKQYKEDLIEKTSSFQKFFLTKQWILYTQPLSNKGLIIAELLSVFVSISH